jgi:hypothetical protein
MPIDQTKTVEDFKTELSAWLKAWENKPTPPIGHVSFAYHVMLKEKGAIDVQLWIEHPDAKGFREERHDLKECTP